MLPFRVTEQGELNMEQVGSKIIQLGPVLFSQHAIWRTSPLMYKPAKVQIMFCFVW